MNIVTDLVGKLARKSGQKQYHYRISGVFVEEGVVHLLMTTETGMLFVDIASGYEVVPGRWTDAQ